jgi:hypothetical protein
MAQVGPAAAAPPSRGRGWGWIVVFAILGAATVFLGYTVLFVVPISHPFSFVVPKAGCQPPTTTWNLPDGSHVSRSWSDGGTSAVRVNITAPGGAMVYEGTGFNGSYTFSSAGANSFTGGSTLYTVEAWPLPIYGGFGGGCVIFPTVTFTGTYTGPVL